jgi:hypothetical protein
MWPPRSWWTPLVSEQALHLQLMLAGRALRRARLAAYKSDRWGRGGFLPLRLAFAVLASCASAPEPFSPLRFYSQSFSCFRFPASLSVRMAPQQPLVIIDPPAWERSTETRGRRPAGGKRGWAAGRVDRAVGEGASAQPSVRLVGAKSALNAKHTASRTKLASHAQRAKDVPVNFS